MCGVGSVADSMNSEAVTSHVSRDITRVGLCGHEVSVVRTRGVGCADTVCGPSCLPGAQSETHPA